MEKYIHKVNYYETDKMGITHHSNYIRWMEEARIYLWEQIGFGYAKLEADEIISPLIDVKCEYKSPTTFAEEIEIGVEIEEFKGVRLIVKYTMVKCSSRELVLTGRTTHCFVNNENKPISLKRNFPEFAEKLNELLVSKK